LKTTQLAAVQDNVVVHIPDVQATADTRKIAINRVGIKDIRHPIRFTDRSQQVQHTVAHCNMYVNLPHHFKGTHMSRFVDILNGHETEISVSGFGSLLAHMNQRLEADTGYIEMQFDYFVNKTAPVSGVQSLLDYKVRLLGKLDKGEATINVETVVPVTTLCPCSKKIARYGAHNQRSHVTLNVRLREHIWVEELIDLVEQEASCELYSLLKRPDEKYITERAYDNPKFVEDLVRDIAVHLNQNERISAYSVASENFESIHNHSAYAVIECDKEQAASG